MSGRVRKLPEEIDFFREEWKKLEKWYFFQFLLEESGKKLEESGRNWKKYMKPNKDTNKLVEISSQILLSNTGMSMQICISQFWNFARCQCSAQCCPIHSIISCIQGLNLLLKCLHLEHLIFHIYLFWHSSSSLPFFLMHLPLNIIVHNV